MDIAQEAIHYYETDNKAKLLKLAQDEWPSDLETPIREGAADVFYFARSIEWRHHKGPAPAPVDPANRDAIVGRELWHARAITAAILTGANHTVSRLLIGRAFFLIELKAYEEARSVLAEMLRLVDEGHELRRVFMRLYEEKVAFSYLDEGLYSEAGEHYKRALPYGDVDPRGALKVRGGLVLSQWLQMCAKWGGRGIPADRIDEYVAELREVRDAALAAGYGDVVSDADHNVTAIEAGDCKNWRPFELL